jgi:hypothetical protein
LDPTGAWWGLRAAADGKSEGLPVVIIGGEHGDVPLEPTAGKVIADLVVDHPGFYVIDLSSTESNAEQDRFATDFAERLYRRKNKVRTPLHLFVDEADAFAPQRPFEGQQRMLGAFEALVRRGGIRGIGTTLITQRPAILNKNVLTQSECLIVLQMNAPQDQDAVDDWVQRNGTKQQRDIMMQSLASLRQGEGWFWSPGWLRAFQQIRIRQRRTFNSSATPKAGEKIIVPQKLAPIDLDKLGKEIAATIERANENDPAALKRKISELKSQIVKLERTPKPVAVKPVVQEIKIEVPVLTPPQEKLLSEIQHACAGLNTHLAKIAGLADAVKGLEKQIHDRLLVVQKTTVPIKLPPIPRTIPNPVMPAPPRSMVVPDGEIKLGKCERSLLTVLVQYPEGRTSVQLAVLTGYSVNGGSFRNGLGFLRTQGFVTRTHPIKATQAGMDALGKDWEPLPMGDELKHYWLSRLSKCERTILKALLAIYPEGKTPEDLGTETGYSADGGSFRNALGRLRTLELVQRGQPIKASEHFFQ